MGITWIGCLLYGLISGFFSFLPVSAPAHQFLFTYLSGIGSGHYAIALFALLGTLVAVIICCWKRLVHMRRELYLATLPKRRRNRVPDMQAVSSFRLIMMGLIPVVIGLVFSQIAANTFQTLPWICLFSILSGIVIFLPQFFPLGTKDSRNLRPVDGVLLGCSAALSVIPGISGISLMLYSGGKRGCSRNFMLELALLFTIPLIFGSMIVQLILWIVSAQAMTWYLLLCGFCAGLAAFGGAIAAISLMRYMAVKVGFHSFAYYSWGFAVFCFIYYLIT